MSDDDIEIGVEHSAEEDEGSSSSGGKRIKKKPVRVKGEFGTELLKPSDNGTCKACDEDSTGVMRMREEGIVTGVPLCDEHKESVESSAEYAHRNVTVEWTPWKRESDS